MHRTTRRANFHDYTKPWIYMLTYTERPNRPPLSILNPDASITHTELGNLIEKELRDIPLHHPEMAIYDYIIMPDHIHFILHVKEKLEKPLGREICGFSGACTNHYRSLFNVEAKDSLFFPFHDRLLTGKNQLATMKSYIASNPRRLHIKRLRPDLFRRYNHLKIGDKEFAAYGNIFLLRNFDRQSVVIHRADSEKIRIENERRWLDCVSNGGVLISPFISRDEKAIRDKAIELGGSLIILRNEGFEERFKPQGREFELCTEGRLLLLAPWPDNLHRASVTRAQALEMNALAASLSAFSGNISLVN